MSDTYFLSQKQETPVEVLRSQRFTLRFTYARATETRIENETGQDFLAFRADDDKLVFALCDGVSQSFFGDFAARFLGHSLIDWLWKKKPHCNDLQNLADDFNSLLLSLTEIASKKVQEIPLPNDIPPMFREVLEEKRVFGSESTFICGRIDFQKQNQPGQIFFSWMGDSRLRLWTNDTELAILQHSTFRTQERWSTRQGPVNGAPHVFCSSFEQAKDMITRIAVYSDGFVLFDDYDYPLPTQEIQELIFQSWNLPGSDDISFLEIWLQPYPLILDDLYLDAPRRIQVHPKEDHFQISWERIDQAENYEIELRSSAGIRRKTVINNYIAVKRSLVDTAFRIRAIANDVSGLWSPWITLQKPVPVGEEGEGQEALPPPPPPPSDSVGSTEGAQREEPKKTDWRIRLLTVSSLLLFFIGVTFLAVYGFLEVKDHLPFTKTSTPTVTSTPIIIYIPPIFQEKTLSTTPKTHPTITIDYRLTTTPALSDTPALFITPTPSPTISPTSIPTQTVTPIPTHKPIPTPTTVPIPLPPSISTITISPDFPLTLTPQLPSNTPSPFIHILPLIHLQ